MLKLLVVLSLCSLSMVSAQKQFKLPVVLPPFGVEGSDVKPGDDKFGTCLFYMENLGVVVFQDKSASPTAWAGVISANEPKNQFKWTENYANCIKNGTKSSSDSKTFTSQNFTFVVDVSTADTGVPAKQKDKTLFTLKGDYKFNLTFETVVGYGWRLVDVVAVDGFTVESGDWLKSKLTIKPGSAEKTSVNKMEVGAFGDYNYGCSGTKVAIFKADGNDKTFVGVYFGNVQIQPYGYALKPDKSQVHFSHRTSDCVGTFTHGSLMGIIVAFVLATVLVFGFLMLNSVQGVDRFDDPKQKQLIINAKE